MYYIYVMSGPSLLIESTMSSKSISLQQYSIVLNPATVGGAVVGTAALTQGFPLGLSLLLAYCGMQSTEYSTGLPKDSPLTRAHVTHILNMR